MYFRRGRSTGTKRYSMLVTPRISLRPGDAEHSASSLHYCDARVDIRGCLGSKQATVSPNVLTASNHRYSCCWCGFFIERASSDGLPGIVRSSNCPACMEPWPSLPHWQKHDEFVITSEYGMAMKLQTRGDKQASPIETFSAIVVWPAGSWFARHNSMRCLLVFRV